jgi:hypothetical protein
MFFCLTSAYESYTCQHNSSSAIEDNYNQDITSNSKFKKTDDAVQFAGNHEKEIGYIYCFQFILIVYIIFLYMLMFKISFPQRVPIVISAYLPDFQIHSMVLNNLDFRLVPMHFACNVFLLNKCL